MDAGSSDLRSAQMLWTLGLLEPSDLPEVATKSLVAGLDTPSLRILAGSDGEESLTLNKLFEQVLSEGGLSPLTRAEAARRYAAVISGCILRGDVTTIEGARIIGTAARRVDDRKFHDLDPFIYCESEYDDPELREHFEPDQRGGQPLGCSRRQESLDASTARGQPGSLQELRRHLCAREHRAFLLGDPFRNSSDSR